MGRAVAGGLTAATFAGLAGAHAYSHDDDVAQRVRAVAPGLAQQLDATLVTHSPYARLVDELRDAGATTNTAPQQRVGAQRRWP